MTEKTEDIRVKVRRTLIVEYDYPIASCPGMTRDEIIAAEKGDDALGDMGPEILLENIVSEQVTVFFSDQPAANAKAQAEYLIASCPDIVKLIPIKKIQAIKETREVLKIGLKEAKEAVEYAQVLANPWDGKMSRVEYADLSGQAFTVGSGPCSLRVGSTSGAPDWLRPGDRLVDLNA